MNTKPIVVDQIFKSSNAAVWKAITDPAQMRQWFFESISDFKPEVGFETLFDVECEGTIYPHKWTVTEVLPETKIVYKWQYVGYPGDSVVVWRLSALPNGTKLNLTHLGSETFPQDNPIFSRENGIAGWTYLIQESLKVFLTK